MKKKKALTLTDIKHWLSCQAGCQSASCIKSCLSELRSFLFGLSGLNMSQIYLLIFFFFFTKIEPSKLSLEWMHSSLIVAPQSERLESFFSVVSVSSAAAEINFSAG